MFRVPKNYYWLKNPQKDLLSYKGNVGILRIDLNNLLGQNPTFNCWASYKVVYSESFNFHFLGLWASKIRGP